MKYSKFTVEKSIDMVSWVQIMGGLGGLSPPRNITGGLAMDPVPPPKNQVLAPPLFVI